MENEKISVIIPIYKVEKYLDKCVESVVNQTYKNLEIILVDDGSPDNCPKMCDEWAKKDNRIKVIHKPNGGLSDARNAGLDNMTGKYVTFLDSDDYLDSAFCKTLYDLIKKYNADFAAAFLKWFSDDPNEPMPSDVYLNAEYVEKYVEEDLVPSYLFKKEIPNFVSSGSKLYKKEIFNDIRFDYGKLHEDAFILPKILLNTKSFVYTNKLLYNYYQRSTSIMHTRKDKSYQDVHEANLFRVDFVLKHFPKYTQEAINWVLWQTRYYYRRMNKKIVSKKVRKEWIQTYKKYYKLLNKKSLKDIIFYYFPFV